MYVDDMLVCASSEALESEVESILIKEFKDITSKDGHGAAGLGGW